MSYNRTDLADGCTLYEVKTRDVDDVVGILHDDEIPWFIKRDVAKHTLGGKSRLFAFIEIEANESLDLINKFASAKVEVVDKIPKRKIRKLERKLRSLRKELQEITKGWESDE